MDHLIFSDEAADLLLAVERLSTQDQRRIVRLIGLLAQASDELREQTQDILRRLIAREPETQAECLRRVDEIIARVELQLEIELRFTSSAERAKELGDGMI